MIDFNQTVQGILRFRAAFSRIFENKGKNFGLISLVNAEVIKPKTDVLQMDKQLKLFEEKNSKSKNENGGENNMTEMNFDNELRNLIGGSEDNQCNSCNSSDTSHRCCIPCIPCNWAGEEGLGGLEVCRTIDRTVTACCTEVIPTGIAIQSGEGTRRVLFDIRNLRCLVERCALVENNVVVGSRFSVRIVGCLTYIASIGIRSDAAGVCTEPGNSFAFLCCRDCVNVDNVIARFETQAAAEAFCAQALTCGRITAEISNPVVSNTGNACGDRVVNFTITFTFRAA